MADGADGEVAGYRVRRVSAYQLLDNHPVVGFLRRSPVPPFGLRLCRNLSLSISAVP